MEGFIQTQTTRQEEEQQRATSPTETIQTVLVEESVVALPEMNTEVLQQQEALEKAMNHDMEFLSGLFKMSTGKNLDTENQKIEIDKKTGEVVMRFNMPGF